MAFAENFDEFFDTSQGFAVEALYSNSSNAAVHPDNAVPIDIIDDYVYVDENGFQTSRPTCLAKDSDIPSIAEDDKITIKAIAYLIKEFHPDGTGNTVLELEKI